MQRKAKNVRQVNQHVRLLHGARLRLRVIVGEAESMRRWSRVTNQILLVGFPKLCLDLIALNGTEKEGYQQPAANITAWA
jgi:hypothetical protein